VAAARAVAQVPVEGAAHDVAQVGDVVLQSGARIPRQPAAEVREEAHDLVAECDHLGGGPASWQAAVVGQQVDEVAPGGVGLVALLVGGEHFIVQHGYQRGRAAQGADGGASRSGTRTALTAAASAAGAHMPTEFIRRAA
jgi:hypothetical protein